MTAVADHILSIVQSHDHDAVMVTGYVLLARTLDAAGKMHRHVLTPRDQSCAETAEILNKDGHLLVQD